MAENYPEPLLEETGTSEIIQARRHKKGKKSPLIYTDFSDISAALEGYDFIEDFLCKRNVSVFFGPSKSGKTLFVTDMALHVALEIAWFGRQVEKGCVMYFSLEGQQVVMNRVAAFKKHHGLEGKKCPFRLFKGPISLLHNKDDAEMICLAAQEMEKEFGLPVLLIVIDTWSRANPGGKEDTEDTSKAFSCVDYIKDETGANVCILHHTPNNGDDPRGSGIMQANPDILVKISKDKQTKIGTAKTHSQRDGEGDHEFHFVFESVKLGENKRGNDVVSCVILSVEAPEMNRQALLSGQTKRAYQVLVNLINDVGIMRSPKTGMQPVSVVPLKLFREHLKKADIASTDNEGTIKRAITRVLNAFKNKGIAEVWEDYIWIKRQEGQ